MANASDEIIKEANRISEGTDYTSVQHFIAAKQWRNTHLCIGITAMIFAVIVTALSFSPAPNWIAGSLGIFVAILTGLLTFLNPKDRAEEHQRKGVELQYIRDEARILENIDSVQMNDDELNAQLIKLRERKFKTDLANPSTPGGSIFRKAKKSVVDGTVPDLTG
jgi:hypothetical protein